MDGRPVQEVQPQIVRLSQKGSLKKMGRKTRLVGGHFQVSEDLDC